MLLTYPLMVAIQEISARVGRVTGRGLAGNICRHYPGWMLQAIVLSLFAANAGEHRRRSGAMAAMRNVGFADRWPHDGLHAVFRAVCASLDFVQYARYVHALKWLSPEVLGRGRRARCGPGGPRR